jgi:uncharacterized protein
VVGRRRWLLTGVALAAAILLLGRVWADAYADFLWHSSLGSEAIWRAQVAAGSALTLASGAVAALFAFVNLLVVRHSVVSLVLPRKVANVEFGEEVPGSVLTRAALVVSLVIGGIMALPAAGWWNVLLAVDGVSFGEVDPYFQNDLGFYVAQLPMERSLYTWAAITSALVGILVVVLYALTPSLRLNKGGIYTTSYVRRHITILGGILLLLLAWSFRIHTYQILSHGTGPDGAFGYVDHAIGIPGNLALAVAAVISGLIVTWAGWSGQTRLAVLGITAVLVLALFVRVLAPAAAHRFASAEEREVRERPYLQTRIGYTRRAFDADRVSGRGFVTPAGIAEAALGVPIWDPLAAAHALRFNDPVASAGRAGWSVSNRTLEMTLSERLPGREPLEGNRWRYVRLDAALAEGGAPVPVGGGDGAGSSVPSVISDGASEHLVVSNSEGGIAGVPLQGRARRLALAWSLRDMDLLVERFPGADPVVVARRSVEERIRAMAPPFTQFGDASVAVVRDTVFWVVPVYSTAGTMPLSRHMEVGGESVNWLRHSVTALVNGTSGRLKFVIDSAPDPVAAAWRRRFPSIFTTWAAVDPEIRSSVPPPRVGTRTIAVAYARYGARDERLGRGGHIPPWNGADSLLAGERHVIGYPGSDRPVSVYPVTDAGDSLVGSVIARGGGDGAIAWQASPTGVSWAEAARLMAEASDGRTSPTGAIRGAVRVIPLAGTIALAQPEYHWPEGGAPLLRRVAILDGDTIRHGPTLAELAGVSPIQRERGGEDLAAVALRLYERMRAALSRSDWAAFGSAMDSLGGILRGEGR